MHGGYPQEGTPATSTPSASNVLIDGTALIIDSYGITAEERDALAAQIVPGSGLPWVLPVDGWEWMGMETGADRALWYHQTFGGTVLLDAHFGAGILLEVTTVTDVLFQRFQPLFDSHGAPRSKIRRINAMATQF